MNQYDIDKEGLYIAQVDADNIRDGANFLSALFHGYPILFTDKKALAASLRMGRMELKILKSRIEAMDEHLSRFAQILPYPADPRPVAACDTGREVYLARRDREGRLTSAYRYVGKLAQLSNECAVVRVAQKNEAPVYVEYNPCDLRVIDGSQDDSE